MTVSVVLLILELLVLRISCFTLPRQTGVIRRPSPVMSGVSSKSSVSSSSSSTHPQQERWIQLLHNATGFNSSGASELLSEWSELRSNAPSPDQVDFFWSELLACGPDAPLPWWTRFRVLARFSKRARLAALARVLDTFIKQEEEQDATKQQGNRRRSFAIVLRALADEKPTTVPAIVTLERNSRRNRAVNYDNLRTRLPEGLETPSYTIVASREGGRRRIFEVRDYKPFSTCVVAMNQPRPSDSSKTDAKLANPQLPGASAFGALAGYLFGKNQQETAMKMTTPVIKSGDDQRMAFVLPSEYWKEDGLEQAPKPLAGSGVDLEQDAGGERAVVMFGGFATKKEVQANKKQLLDALKKDRYWEAVNTEVTVAQYNDPFTPPWKRLNEVSVPVRRRADNR